MKRTMRAVFAVVLVVGGVVLGAAQAGAAPDGTRVTSATAASADGREDGWGNDAKDQSIGDGQNW